MNSHSSSSAAPALEHGHLPARGQPKGLWVLFITEMWERFSYYGMRALLMLYLIAKTGDANHGFGWTEEEAGPLYGWYTGLVYLTPILGGLLADRLLGTHRSLLLGGYIIAAGHVCLACTELFAITAPGVPVTMATAPGRLVCFLSGLLLIIIGTGFFKPCVSAMVGQLYAADDPRRDSGFTIFYMGINVGAFFSGVVAGTLGERYGWHWGFGSAAVGMVAGLTVYQIFRPRYLHSIGLAPSYRRAAPAAGPAAGQVPGGPDLTAPAHPPLTHVERGRMAVVLILALFAIAFWIAFEQAGSTLNIFAKEKTNRTLPWGKPAAAVTSPGAGIVTNPEQDGPRRGPSPATLPPPVPATSPAPAIASAPASLPAAASKPATDESGTFPATWYQSVNPLAIVIFAPIFSWLWIFLARRGIHLSTPVKFAMGLLLLSIGFAAMIPASLQAQSGKLAGPHWLLLVYLLATWGELCLSPVGLSMVTRLSPPRYVSLMMGIYFLSNFVANLGAGYAAAFAAGIEKRGGLGILGGQADFFILTTAVPLAVAAVVLALSPTLKRMMHGLD